MDKNKSDYFYCSHKMKISNFRDTNKAENKTKIQNIEQRNARNLKFSDINKYINNANNINIHTNRISQRKPYNQSLHNYFNLNKLNQDKKSINSSIKVPCSNNQSHKIYNNINIYHHSFIERKKENFRNKKQNKYSKTERIVQNNSNEDLDKINKEKKILRLKKILEELKSENNNINKDLILISKQNSELEKKANIQNNNIYINIKNKLDNISNQNHIFNNKLYNSLSFEEKCKYIRKIYLDSKLQKTLIEKMFSLYHNLYSSVNEADINSANDNDLNNLLNWVISLVENKNVLHMKNEKLKYIINEKIKEKKMYKNYFNKWAKMLGANSKEKIFQNINELIKEQNMNNNEKNKMIKMLFNNH